jgi:antitoxin (DNA-binding transcriptional repressor) of toxin-antitoxin stability system
VDGEGVEQLVGEDDAGHAPGGLHFAPVGEPPHARGEHAQAAALPLLPARRGIENPILHALPQIGPPLAQPEQDILGQLTVVRAGLDDLQRSVGRSAFRIPRSEFVEPLGELKREQLPEQLADAHAGVEVTALPHHRAVAFVVAQLRMVERHLHEARAGDRAGAPDLVAQNRVERRRFLAVGLRIGYDTAKHKPGLFLWPRLTPSST